MRIKSNNVSSNISKKRERFIRIAENRVNKVLDGLDALGKCSNKRNYDYLDEDVKAIFREIERKMKEVKMMYHGTLGATKKFTLKR